MANSALEGALTQFRSNLTNLSSDVGQNITRAAAPVSNFVKQATNLFAPNKSINVPSLNYRVNDLQQKQSPIVKNFIKTAQKGIQDWATKNPVKATNIINAPSRLAQKITEPIAAIPYKTSMDKIQLQKKNLFAIPEKFIPKRTFIPQSRPMPEQFQTPAPNMSFIPDDQILIKRESNPELEAIKQKILSGNNVRPSAREYLSDIPINFSESGADFSGASFSDQTPFRQIQINPDIMKPITVETAPGVFRQETKEEVMGRVDKTLNEVIKHELLHQTPELVPKKYFQPRNPIAINTYVQRWGKKYFTNPKDKKIDEERLVGEMFSEEALPPVYYWHVFKKVVPDAKPRDFVRSIKSFFSNNINKPETTFELTPQLMNSLIPFDQRVKRGIPGTSVPNVPIK